jgi:predicted permease
MGQLIRRLGVLLRFRRVDADLVEELDAHLARKQQSLEARGVNREDAARTARRALGNVLVAQENARDVWYWPWLRDVTQDLGFAARLLTRDRWFTLVAVLALSLAIGVNNTVFALVNAALIRAMPFEQPDRIVVFGTRDPRFPAVAGPPGYRGLSFPDLQDWSRAPSEVFAGIGAYVETTMNVSDDERVPERILGSYLSANLFDLIGRQPLVGRGFRAEDDRSGAPAVAILGHRVWISRYRGDPEILGRTVRINGRPSNIIGIMPDGFRFPSAAAAWQPLGLLPGLEQQARDARVLTGLARLAPGVGIGEARDALDTIAIRLARELPATNANIRATVWPFHERYVAPQVELIILALMGAVGLVLLVACANVANLLLARAAQRSSEIAIRASLGATRWRIVRQLLVESLLLAAAGGAGGLAFSLVGVRLLSSVLMASAPPYWLDLTLDGWSVVFLTGVCFATALVFGLAPALHASRSVAGTLSERGRTGTGGIRVRRWTGALVTVELALTLVLLAGAGFMMRAFLILYRTNTEIDTSRIVTTRLDLPSLKYPSQEQRAAFYERLEDRLRALPVISSAAIASGVPFGSAPARRVEIEGRPLPEGDTPPSVPTVTVGAGYFETLGLRALGGRVLTSQDGTVGREPAAVVNERFAAMFLPGDAPVGRRIRLTSQGSRGDLLEWVTIVGVVPTVRRDESEGRPLVYLPIRTEPGPVAALIVRSEREPGDVVPLLREEVRALDPDLPLFDIRTLDEWLAFLRWPERVFGTMFTIFACIAVVLSGVGLYAVTAHAVRQRTREIGIRIALGAAAPQVWWLILRQVMAQVGIGLLLGLPGALAVAGLPWMGPRQPLVLVPVALVLVCVAAAACIVPARRATQTGPGCGASIRVVVGVCEPGSGLNPDHEPVDTAAKIGNDAASRHRKVARERLTDNPAIALRIDGDIAQRVERAAP